MQVVQVNLVPEQGFPNPPNPECRFWVNTNGLHAHGLPEIEIREVPPMYVGAAGDRVNAWAYYSLRDCPIEAGEALGSEEDPIQMRLLAVESPDPFWMEHGRRCLRLVVDQVAFHCCACGEGEHPREEE